MEAAPLITVPEALLYDVRVEDVWEYGVNGVHGEEHFDGFLQQSNAAFPLATRVYLTDSRLNLLWEHHVLQFKALDFWQNIVELQIDVPIGEECLEYILNSPKFAGLKSLKVNGRDCLTK